MVMREEQARFFGKVATLMEAGIPIIKALEVARERVVKADLAAALDRILDRTYQGTSFTDSFAAESPLFTPEILCLIEEGEKMGDLDHKAAAIAAGLSRGDLEAGVGGASEPREALRAWLGLLRSEGAVAVHVDPGPVVRARGGESGGLVEVPAPPGLAALLEAARTEPGVEISEFPYEDGTGVVLRVVPQVEWGPLDEIGVEPAREALASDRGLLLVAGPDPEERADLIVALARLFEGRGRKVVTAGCCAEPFLRGARRAVPGSSNAIRALEDQDLDALWLDDLEPVAHPVLRAIAPHALVVAGIHAEGPVEALRSLEQPAGGKDLLEDLILTLLVPPAWVSRPSDQASEFTETS